jgi:hypothetical protein
MTRGFAVLLAFRRAGEGLSFLLSRLTGFQFAGARSTSYRCRGPGHRRLAELPASPRTSGFSA